jgi:hypothetical protein
MMAAVTSLADRGSRGALDQGPLTPPACLRTTIVAVMPLDRSPDGNALVHGRKS